ncbi:MAG: hypothetical protein AAFP19_20005, partial [Bacteroidota bacterium]
MKTKMLIFLCLGLGLSYFTACQKESISPTSEKKALNTDPSEVQSSQRMTCNDFDLCDCRARITEIIGTLGTQTSLNAAPPFGSPLPSDCNLFQPDPVIDVWYDFQVIQSEQWFLGLFTNSQDPITYTIEYECPDFSRTATGPATSSIELTSNCFDCECELTVTDVVTDGPEETNWIAEGPVGAFMQGGVTNVPQSATFGHIGGTDAQLRFDAFYEEGILQFRYPLTTISYTLDCGDTELSSSVTVGSANPEIQQPTTKVDVAIDEECDFSLPQSCNCTATVESIPLWTAPSSDVWVLDMLDLPADNLEGTSSDVPMSRNFVATAGTNFSINALMEKLVPAVATK